MINTRFRILFLILCCGTFYCSAQNSTQNSLYIRGSFGNTILNGSYFENLTYPSGSFGIGVRTYTTQCSNINFYYDFGIDINRRGSKRKINLVAPYGTIQETNNLINAQLNSSFGIDIKKLKLELVVGFYKNISKNSKVKAIGENEILVDNNNFTTYFQNNNFKNLGLVLGSKVSYPINRSINLGISINTYYLEGRNFLNSSGLRYISLSNFSLVAEYNFSFD